MLYNLQEIYFLLKNSIKPKQHDFLKTSFDELIFPILYKNEVAPQSVIA